MRFVVSNSALGLVSARSRSRHPVALRALLLCAATTCATTATARAQSAPLTLDAQLPASLQPCISTPLLQTSYDRLQTTADPTEPPSTAPLRVELRSEARSGGEVTRVVLRAFRSDRVLGERTLPIRPRDCAALPDTVALVVQVLTRSAPREPPPPSAAAPPPVVQAAFEPEPTPAPGPVATSSEDIWSVGLGAGVIWGMLPKPAFAPQLMAAARLPFLELRLHLSGMLPEQRAVEEGTVRMWTYEAGLDACEALHFDPWVVRLCIGPRFGLTRATSRNFIVRNRDLTEFSLYLAALPELAFALRSTTWIQLTGGISIGLQRPKFVLEFDGGTMAPLSLDGPQTVRAEVGLSVMQSF